MKLKWGIVIRPVPLSHIPYRNWPYCIACHEVRMFNWHRCPKESSQEAWSRVIEAWPKTRGA